MNHTNNKRQPNHNADIERASKLMQHLLDEDIAPAIKTDIREWFRTEANEQGKLDALRGLFDELQPNLTPDSYEYEKYDEIRLLLGFEKPGDTPARIKKRMPLGNRLLRYAAVLIPAMIVAGATYLWVSRSEKIMDPITVMVAAGNREQIFLPDSTAVILNGESVLTYDDNRTCSFEGEGFFTVTKDDEPFIIHTGQMDITVFGTEFNLNAFPDEDIASITLYTGSVQAQAGQQSIMLHPNEVLTFNRSTSQMSVRQADDLEPAWLSGRLLIEDCTPEEIIRICRRNFSATIACEGSFSGLRHSMSFDPGHSLEDVLDILQLLENFTYTIENNTVQITTYSAQ